MLGIFLISFISAVTIYSGEPTTITLDKDYVYYSIVGNSSPVVLYFNQTGLDITITPDKYSSNDTYELVFFDKEKEVITVYSGGGGGGGTRTEYVDKIIYKDKPVEKIKEVEKVVEKEVPVETIINKIPSSVYVLIG